MSDRRDDLSLSAMSVQDYLDCRRRFQLYALDIQSWPGMPVGLSQERERRRQQAIEFHRLLERYYLGMDSELLLQMVSDIVARFWWQRYLALIPVDRDDVELVFPEKWMQVWLEGFLLKARLDLLVVGRDGSVVVFDWKTTKQKPEFSDYLSRVQTRVYLYVIGEQVASLLGRSISLSQVKMVYWFVEYPESSVVIEYSDVMHRENKLFLGEIFSDISRDLGNLSLGEWSKTENLGLCRLCSYCTLCDRGVGVLAVDVDSQAVDDYANYFDGAE